MKYFIVLIPLLIGVGCSSNSQPVLGVLEANTEQTSKPGSKQPLDEDVIIKNIVYALAQLPELHPFSTTLSLKRATTPLAELIETRFVEAGYGLRYVQSDEGNYYVRHSAVNSSTEDGETTTYTINVGPISAERDFMLDERGTFPASVLRVKGASENDILLYDAVFGDELANTRYKDVYFEVNNDPLLVDTGTARTTTPTSSQRKFGNLVKHNMRDTMSSNFIELFDNYENVDQTILVFQNDSLRIGAENKDTVRDYVRSFNPATDILSVVGCSHGNAKAIQPGKRGNQLLAIGRANRVKEALIFAGIDQEHIFEEACWDDEHFDGDMPRRGVVLTHKRRVSNG